MADVFFREVTILRIERKSTFSPRRDIDDSVGDASERRGAHR
ncbi:MAG: hypothetical protein ACR2RF_18815 [Geminicoccaceae bacterium]